MYKSPIEIIIEQTAKKINEYTESRIYETVCTMGVKVDKPELIKALQYDRDQYSKGFQDGKELYEDALDWITENFGVPCQYTIGNVNIAEFIEGEAPGYCGNFQCSSDKECWRRYFELRKKMFTAK